MGDTKTMEIAARAEELCSRLGDELLTRIKESEVQPKTGGEGGKVEETLAKQRVDFEVLQKSIKTKLTAAIEDMQTSVARALRAVPSATITTGPSIVSASNQPENERLAESFGARLEKATEERKGGESLQMSPFAKARMEAKDETPGENEASDDSMILYRNYLKKRAEQASQDPKPTTKATKTKKARGTSRKSRSTSRTPKEKTSQTGGLAAAYAGFGENLRVGRA